MGAEASKPQAGAQLQVIGAGLSRTGTASFSAALQILLQGPVYHGGTEIIVSGDEEHIRSWTEILSLTPYTSPSDRQVVLDRIRDLTTGYVATTDSPPAQFVPELMELYPDAKVICTIRDPDDWSKSIEELAKNTLQPRLQFLVYWVPCLTHLPTFMRLLQQRYAQLYFESGEAPVEPLEIGKEYRSSGYQRHIDHLKRVVPEDKLFFVDVRDGWAPLCAALGVDVPEGVEFPRINDGKAIEKLNGHLIREGLVRWAILFGATACVAALGLKVLKQK